MSRHSNSSGRTAPLDPSGSSGVVASEKVASGGVDALIRRASAAAHDAWAQGIQNDRVIRQLGDEFAYIRLDDIWHPQRFLRQMAGNPPHQLGTAGFNPTLVDDRNPARHYMAFVCMGYWLPKWMAVATLWLWEMAGFVRYGGEWSWPDIRSGQVGIRHGQMAKRYGVVVLPSLIAAELADRPDVPSGKSEEG